MVKSNGSGNNLFNFCMCVCVPVGVWGRTDIPQVFQNNLS